MIRINRLLIAKSCPEGLKFYDLITGGAPTFEVPAWTAFHESGMQSQVPQFITWLRAKRLIPFPNFAGMDLSGLTFVGSDFRGADLSNTKLVGTDFTRANLRRSVLVGTNLLEPILQDADLEFAHYDGPPPDGWTLDEQGRLVRA